MRPWGRLPSPRAERRESARIVGSELARESEASFACKQASYIDHVMTRLSAWPRPCRYTMVTNIRRSCDFLKFGEVPLDVGDSTHELWES
jgi:hypothetical protein